MLEGGPRQFAGAVMSVVLLIALCLPLKAVAQELSALVNQLGDASAAEKRELLVQIAQTNDVARSRVFEALSRGALYLNRKNAQVVLGERKGARYRTYDLFSGEELETLRRRDVKRVAIDNELRSELQILQAIGKLASQDAETRRSAVDVLLADSGEAAQGALKQRRDRETDLAIRDEIDVGLALATIRGATAENTVEKELREALRTLQGRTEPSVRAALAALQASSTATEPLRGEAGRMLRLAESRLRWLSRFEALFFGLSLGSVLMLSGIGLAITFGVMGVINMAHGELIMLGAYTTWVMQQLLANTPGLALCLSIPAAFLVAGLMGVVIERSVIRFLYGRPLETLLATFGVSLLLQQTVRTLFSPLNRSVVTPDWLSGAWEITPGLALTYNRLAILLFSLAVFAALISLMRFSRFGLQVRAVAQNRAMARALGIKSARVDTLTFALGSGIAGVAGVALSQLTNVGPNLGQAYIIDSFLVVVLGGVGNLWGTLVAAFSLGISNKLLEPAVGAVLAKIILLLILILFLQRRPQGLFPRVGRSP